MFFFFKPSLFLSPDFCHFLSLYFSSALCLRLASLLEYLLTASLSPSAAVSGTVSCFYLPIPCACACVHACVSLSLWFCLPPSLPLALRASPSPSLPLSPSLLSLTHLSLPVPPPSWDSEPWWLTIVLFQPLPHRHCLFTHRVPDTHTGQTAPFASLPGYSSGFVGMTALGISALTVGEVLRLPLVEIQASVQLEKMEGTNRRWPTFYFSKWGFFFFLESPTSYRSIRETNNRSRKSKMLRMQSFSLIILWKRLLHCFYFPPIGEHVREQQGFSGHDENRWSCLSLCLGLLGKWQNLYWGHVLVTQSCPTLCNPMDCSLPGSSVRGILQARILEWTAMSFFGKDKTGTGPVRSLWPLQHRKRPFQPLWSLS